MKMTYSKITFVASAFFVLGLIIGCSSSTDSSGGETTTTAAETEVETPAEPEMVETTAYCFYNKVSIRSASGKGGGEWLATMNLGEKVTFLGDTEEDAANDNREYIKVRLSDGKEGWCPANLMLMDGSIAVTLDEISLYDRPDLLTKNGDKMIPRGVIVGLYNSQDDWTEIKGIPHGDTWYTSGWTKSPRTSSDEENIAAALMLTRSMDDKLSDEDKLEMLETIVNDLPNSVFAVDANDMIAEMEAEMGDGDTMIEVEMVDDEEGDI